ncbi:hypothetical protein [Cellulomonas sp. P5_C6]
MSTVRNVEVSGADGTAPAADRTPRRSWWLGDQGRSVLAYLAAVLGTIGFTAWAERLWLADLHVPFRYYGDAIAVSAHVKTTLQTGWYEYQPLLGAPAGQSYHDYPAADNLHLLIMKMMGWVLQDWAVTLNVYFLIGFPLAALTGMVFFRAVRVGRISSAALAILFALAPYHFMRSEDHLFLASYYPVPLGLILVVRVLRGQPLWTLNRGSVRAVLTSPALATLAITALVSSGASYYGVFMVVLLAVCGLASLVHRRDWRRFGGAVMAGIAFLGFIVTNMLPDILWQHSHGDNAGSLVRSAGDAEFYALKITSLLLPQPGHAVPFLSTVRAWYDGSYPLASEQPVLGAVGAFGLVALIAIAVLRVLRPMDSVVRVGWRLTTLVELAGITLIALLFSTVGGLATIISFVSPVVRGWNRMAILISALTLAAVGLMLDGAREWFARRSGARAATAVAALVAVLMVLGGVYDQVAPIRRPDHAANQAAFAADGAWVADVEAEFGAGTMVAQLPHAGFPETAPVNGVLDSDQLRPFLHSDTLRWTGGGIKGRSVSDWMTVPDVADPTTAAALLAAADAGAAVLDRQALGDTASTVSDAWRAAVGDPVVVSADGRFEVYDLRPLRAALITTDGQDQVDAAGDGAVHPTLPYPGSGVQVGTADGGSLWVGPGDGLDIVLDNARSSEARVRLTFRTDPNEGPVHVSWDGGSLDVTPGGLVDAQVLAPSGHSTVTVRHVDRTDLSAIQLFGVRTALLDRPTLTIPSS